MPSNFGWFGVLSDPTALITDARVERVGACRRSPRTSTLQRPVSSWNVAPTTVVSKRMFAASPHLSTTCSKYARSSGWREKYSVQWSAGSNE